MSEEAENRLSRSDDELLMRVDEVLHYLWDPIGVSDFPEARDEYTSYAGVVFSLLKRGADPFIKLAFLEGLFVCLSCHTTSRLSMDTQFCRV